MRRHLLYGRFGTKDTAAVASFGDETATEINLLTSRGMLGHGIGNAVEQLQRMGLTPSLTGIDLIILALHVQAADTRISRKSESQDSWTREIRLVVPVRDVQLWEGVSPIIKRALDFLTGDIWTIEFRANAVSSDGWLQKSPLPLVEPPYDRVSLFSGGLDSLIGAIDALERGHIPVLVGHAGDGATSAAQTACLNGLRQRYPESDFGWLRLWMDLQGIEVPDSEHEMTMRGRSFLFFAAGILAGTGLSPPFILTVSENGLIAINVPLDPLRLGSHSTRTTHPFFIARWNEMLAALGVPAKIENSYWDRTKGEMVEDCVNQALLRELVPNSLSCSSPTKGRWRHGAIQQCGYCVPCLIRRAAILKGFGPGADRTSYTIADLAAQVLDSSRAEGQQVRSFQYAINRLKSRPQLTKLLIHEPGPLSDVPLADQIVLADIYRRGLSEVEQLLRGVRVEVRS